MDDAELIRQSLEGSEESFRLLLERHRETMWRAAWRVALNEDDALDICQEAAIRLWKNLYKMRGGDGGSVAGWLRTVTCREALRWVSRKGRNGSHVPLDHPLAMRDPNLQRGPLARASLGRTENEERLKRALAHLPPRQRAALCLRLDEGLSLREIAETMGCSEGTVKSQLSRAAERLRILLGKDE